MPRTDSTAVEGIIEVDASIPVTPFIEVANNLVTRHCTDSDYDDDTLELIERWLSAHFYAIRDMRIDTEKAGPVSQQFQFKVDLGFNVTIYGQQAMLIDSDGNLAALQAQSQSGIPRRAGASWLGKTEEEVLTEGDE